MIRGLLPILVIAWGCGDGRNGVARILGRGTEPDVAPVMLNAEAPFRYPAGLRASMAQGNVVLRLVIDTLGRPLHDSTAIAESSGNALLDSAAVLGATELRFRPAMDGGAPVGVTLLLPVFFRHPAAPPLPGDSALRSPPAMSDRQ
jgi:protein TonB